MKTLITLLTVLLFMGPTWAQSEPENDHNDQKKWSFAITPYAMLAAQSTDVGGTSLRQSFDDLYSLTNAGFQIILSARYKRFYASFDGTFAELGDSQDDPPLMVDLTINQNILGFKFGYVVYEDFNFEEDQVIKGWSLRFNAGTKAWINKVNVDYTLTFAGIIVDEDTLRETQEWWDLMLGVNTRFVISKKFELGVGLDVGGFGIGDSSKFAYDFLYSNSFKVSKLIVIHAGFRNFRYERVDGPADDELKTKVNVLGPVLGVSFVL